MNENSNDGNFEFNSGESDSVESVQTNNYKNMSGGGFEEDKHGNMSSEPPKGKKWIIPTIVGIVIAIIVVVFILARLGVFSGNKGKIAKALGNTIESGRLGKIYDELPELKGEKFTMTGNLGSEEVLFDFVIKNEIKKQEMIFNMDMSKMGAPEMGFNVFVDGSELNLDLPFMDTLLVYDYEKESSDYAKSIFEESGIDLDEIAQEVSEGSSGKDTELEKVIKKEEKNIKVKKIDKKEFEVDGKTISCDGYSATIENDSIKNIGEALNKSYQDDVMENSFDFEDFTSDVIMDFYIYDNYIAAIVINVVDQDEYILELKGGEYPTQNMVFSSAKEGILFEVKGETTGSKETTEITVDSETIFKSDYDYDLGNYEMIIYDYYSEIIVKGDIKSSDEDFTLTIAEVLYDDENVFYGSINVREGAKIEDFVSTSQKFDINTLEERDLEELSTKLFEFLMGQY